MEVTYREQAEAWQVLNALVKKLPEPQEITERYFFGLFTRKRRRFMSYAEAIDRRYITPDEADMLVRANRVLHIAAEAGVQIGNPQEALRARNT